MGNIPVRAYVFDDLVQELPKKCWMDPLEHPPIIKVHHTLTSARRSCLDSLGGGRNNQIKETSHFALQNVIQQVFLFRGDHYLIAPHSSFYPSYFLSLPSSSSIILFRSLLFLFLLFAFTY